MNIPALTTRAVLTIADLRRIGAESRANVDRITNNVYEPRQYRVISTAYLLQHIDNAAPVVVHVGDEITSIAVVSDCGVTHVKFEQDGNVAWMWLSQLEEIGER